MHFAPIFHYISPADKYVPRSFGNWWQQVLCCVHLPVWSSY